MKPASKILFVIFLFISFVSNAAAAHVYHTSLTRIDYNEKEKLAEISIQMFPHDLVPILQKRAKKNIDLEKTSDIDTIILNYLNENFVLKDKSGEIKKLVWVGKETQADAIFVYVEILLKEDFDGFNLQNTLFFESFSEQVNLVIARANQKKADLVYKAGDKFKEIELINSSEEKNRDKFRANLPLISGVKVWKSVEKFDLFLKPSFFSDDNKQMTNLSIKMRSSYIYGKNCRNLTRLFPKITQFFMFLSNNVF